MSTAIVTGAGSGIGRSIARALAAGGLELALVGRHAETLRETLPDARIVVADITDPAAVDAAFAEMLGGWPRLDLLVNNAGVFSRPAPLEEVAREDFAGVLAVNLTAAFWCTQHAVRAMKAQSPSGGRIVNIGSVSAHRPRPNSIAYTVSKHGLTGLTRAVGLEGREHGITCTQLDIGNAATPMTAAIPEATFDVAHVGDVVATIAALPTDVAVPELTILAATMPYLGRG